MVAAWLAIVSVSAFASGPRKKTLDGCVGLALEACGDELCREHVWADFMGED